ncbi:MAG: hypothetical protein IPN34_00880 [Planctomycetes bacterium]|nr:hypothetical protein [Planctomycetota bacterium]
MLETQEAPIDGDHYGRQALVMAQIEKSLSTGDLLRAGTYNRAMPPLLFEGPLYQGVVGAITALAGAEALVVARSVNVVLFYATLWTFLALLRALGFGEVRVVFAGVLVCGSPLLLHYQSVPLSDGSAVFCSLIALLGYARLVEGRSSGTGRWAWMALLLGSALAAFVKCTVAIPVAGAVAAHAIGGRRLTRDAARPLLGFVSASAIGLALHLLLRSRVNAGLSIPNESTAWLFGSLGDRFSLATWSALLPSRLELLLPFPAALLSIGGYVVLVIRRGADPARSLLLGWGFACVAYGLVFFPLHVLHAYYQLPFVLPAAACAAALLPARVRAAWRRRAWAAATLSVALVVSATASGKHTLAKLRMPFAATERARGTWLRTSTHERDFLVYLTPMDFDHNDHLLYSARRDGYLLGMGVLERYGLEAFYSIAAGHLFDGAGRPKYRRLCVFAPLNLAPRAAALLREVPQLEVRRNGELGDLYLYPLGP